MGNNKKAKAMKHKLKAKSFKKSNPELSLTIGEAEEKMLDLLYEYGSLYKEITAESVGFCAEYHQWNIFNKRLKESKTPPKTRLILGDNVGNTILLYGSVSEVRITENHRQLLIIEPAIYNTPHLQYKKTLTIDELKKTINNVNDRPKLVDSHLWVDIDTLTYTGNDKGLLVLEGSYIFILGTVKGYRGKVNEDIKRKSIKYTIDKGNVVATGYPVLSPSKRKNIFDIKTIINVDNDWIRDNYRLKWDKKTMKYIVGSAFDEFYVDLMDRCKESKMGINNYCLVSCTIAMAKYLPQYRKLAERALSNKVTNLQEAIDNYDCLFEPKSRNLLLKKRGKRIIKSIQQK